MSKIRMIFLTIFILASIIISSTTCFAEEFDLPDPEQTESDLTEPTETLPVSKSLYPVLTVNAISNYFGKAYAEYNEFTKEVTVTYMLKASKKLLSTRWSLSYDSAILGVDPKKNTAETVCEQMKDNAELKFDGDVVSFSASDLKLFDFTVNEAPFVTIVFDVKDLTAEDSEITTVDLTVDELWVSEPDPVSGLEMPGKEVLLVSNSKVIDDSKTGKVLTTKITTLTPPTYVEPDKNSTPAQALTTDPATTEPTTVPPTTKAPEPKSKPVKEQNTALVNTGGIQIPLIILGAISACSVILLILRKREIYNN